MTNEASEPLRSLPASAFLSDASLGPIVDVRAPAEYLHGHIPSAVSLPLFSDDERAQVGTAYTKRGRNVAIELGLQLIGPKLHTLFHRLGELKRGNRLRIHCWRGGMRSAAMGWLAGLRGIGVTLLEGGYKGYRHHVLECFGRPYQLLVLTGETGSGKTEVLRELAGLGEQVLDLEGMAHHKGSAFGRIGEAEPQPTSEMFENLLAGRLVGFNPSRPIWVEDESLNIGRVVIPKEFFNTMASARGFRLHIPAEERAQRLARIYCGYPPESLCEAIGGMQRRLGGDRAQQAIREVREGRMGDAVRLVLAYYDAKYRANPSMQTQARSTVACGGLSPAEVAALLYRLNYC